MFAVVLSVAVATPTNKERHDLNWEPSRQAALGQLGAFTPRAGGAYASKRNFDLGTGHHEGVSCLSPWISNRLLLEEEVLAKTLSKHTYQSAEKFVSEVFWRGYFKGWLEHRPQVWARYRTNLTDYVKQLERDVSLRRRYEEAVSAKTGIDCFDHWVRELTQTGYLHNHARMWFASIWIFTLEIPWELGADFFYRHLLDGDAASNTCSWRWVGGLHTKGKSYAARASNISKYTNGRFDPTGLARDATPLQEPPLPAPIVPCLEACDIPLGRIGLILCEEDCSPDRLPLATSPTAVLALLDPSPRSVLASSPMVDAFTRGCVSEAAKLAKEKWQADCQEIDSSDWTAVIADWVNKNDLDALATARVPLGPTRKRLMKACRDLDVPLVEVTRPYDAAVWPHAKAGFFGLRKKIPSILSQLGLN